MGAKRSAVELAIVQIVGFERTPDAALLVADGGTIERLPLEQGTTLGFGLGDRHCAGQVVGATHRYCEKPAAPHCPQHADTWVCARCRGTCLKDEMDCFQPHAVYLAIVAPDNVKVGVTRAERFRTRLHEQGADRGAMIYRVENGRIAREIEAELGTEIPERIPTTTKIRGLARAVDERAWERLLATHEPIEISTPSYSLRLPDPPIPDTLATGRVIGTKGRLLVLSVDGSTYVTDLRDLVGYRVDAGGLAIDRQTGLGSFA